MSHYISIPPRGMCLTVCLYLNLFHTHHMHTDIHTYVFTCDSWMLNLCSCCKWKKNSFVHGHVCSLIHYKGEGWHIWTPYSSFSSLSSKYCQYTSSRTFCFYFEEKWVITPNIFCIYYAVFRWRILAAFTVSIIKRHAATATGTNRLLHISYTVQLRVIIFLSGKSIPYHGGFPETKFVPMSKLSMIIATVLQIWLSYLLLQPPLAPQTSVVMTDVL